MKFEIITTNPTTAEENMQFDSELLASLADNPRCLLRFHRWKQPSATYGYFIDPSAYLQLEEISKHGIDLARRPTGGGILFHTCDLSFAILIPAIHPHFSLNTLDNYAFINGAVLSALEKFIPAGPELLPREVSALDKASNRFCMAKPTQFDVMLQGYKIAGGAQRRTKAGYLHQGSIALRLPPAAFLADVLLPGTCVAHEMARLTHPIPSLNPSSIEEALMQELEQILIQETE